jgi:hypothetical protein
MYLKHVHNLLGQRGHRCSQGHAHFHQRAALTRRQFLKAGAVVSAAFFTTQCQGFRFPDPVAGPARPIPGGTQLPDPLGFIHLYIPTPTMAPPGSITLDTKEGDPSSITDFNGTVGVFECFGGTGTDGEGNTLYWAADVRFMNGEYVDANFHRVQGTFAFI